MQRIAYVAYIQPGKEAECREVHEHLPTDALTRLGVHELEAFVGSGALVWVFGCAEQDFQGLFQSFFSDPGMCSFLDKLRPFVQGLPAAGVMFAPADNEHTGDRRPAIPAVGAAVTSAELPFAASAYRWLANESDGK